MTLTGPRHFTAAALEDFHARPAEELLVDPDWPAAHEALLTLLESGEVRSARPDADGGWQAVAWVKRAILLGFRRSEVQLMPTAAGTAFDKGAYPVRELTAQDGVRLVPGGSAVRRGAHLGRGVVLMPPAYVNVGAWVGDGTLVDSHALVGSCAQVGARVHLSAGAQVGGVLEPVGARPVVVEDDVFVGALVGLFEGVIVRRHAVLAAGVILTASTRIVDLVARCERQGEVPEGAVVVPGSRPSSDPWAAERGVQLATPVIVKQRDARTSAAVALEDALR